MLVHICNVSQPRPLEQTARGAEIHKREKKTKHKRKVSVHLPGKSSPWLCWLKGYHQLVCMKKSSSSLPSLRTSSWEDLQRYPTLQSMWSWLSLPRVKEWSGLPLLWGEQRRVRVQMRVQMRM
jgi:hypothetical protein